MLRLSLVLLTALLVAGPAQAQTPSGTTADSMDAVRRAAEQLPNVTVVQESQAAPVGGTWQVRQRIRTLPRRPDLPLRQRTVIYPVFVIVDGSGASRSVVPQRQGRRAMAGPPTRPAQRRADTPADDAGQRPRPPVTPAPAARPTPEVVERQLLETGLFRTVDVMFEFDRSTLLPRSEVTLDAVGEVMTKYPSLRIEVAGHTDSVGSEQYNQRLSERRALAVRQYLLDAFDVAPQRILAAGFGEARPVASNETETGRALNRRVEFVVRNPGVIERR
ncbi:MAG: OmpA family protein [Bacteroidetes bacterium]|jgi:outer membrane protein OmpA-like peptidoglycan-associated protein|nr:OmpA family protein [Bacteroidota bacterium]